MSTTPPDPHDPTRADLPPATAGEDPTVPMERTAAAPTPTGTVMGERPLREEDEDRRRAWWLWALLAAVLIAIVLFALLRDDDDDGVDAVDDTTTETTGPVEDEPVEDDAAPDDGAADDAATTEPPATQAPAAGGDAGDGDGAPGDDGADAGSVTTADGTDLLGLVEGDEGDAERLAPYADADVVGSQVEVLEVVEDEGFWIGVDDERRIFAHGADDVAATVEAGQRIDFDGFLKPNPPADSAEVHDIPDDQGAELHRQQGHHIELRSITPLR